MQEEGLSLLAQSNRLHEYAERKGLEVIRTFEIVESSTRGERKQFMEMINFCKKQKETIAIVADTVDRVQRSFKESVLLDELMRQDKKNLSEKRICFTLLSNIDTVSNKSDDKKLNGVLINEEVSPIYIKEALDYLFSV